MKCSTTILFLSIIWISNLNAQLTLSNIPSDTFRIQNFPLRIWYANDKIKKPKQIQTILLTKNDPQINKDWNQFRTTRNVGIGIQVLGTVIMAAGLIKTIQAPSEENNLVLKGAVVSLGGVIVQLFGTKPFKRAIRRFNDLQKGRNHARMDTPFQSQPEDSSRVSLFISNPDSISKRELSQPLNNKEQTKKIQKLPQGIGIAIPYIGLTLGTGWSKQKINYADQINSPLKHATVFSIELQYGQRTSESRAWELVAGFNQHGLRIIENTTVEGIKVEAKADARARFFEAHYLQSFLLPIGSNKGIRLEALTGISLGYWTSLKIVSYAKGEGNGTKVKVKSKIKRDLSNVDFTDKLDAAILLGLRGTKDYGPGRFVIDGGYHFGIINLDRNSDTTGDKLKTFNRTFMLKFGYQIPLDKIRIKSHI